MPVKIGSGSGSSTGRCPLIFKLPAINTPCRNLGLWTVLIYIMSTRELGSVLNSAYAALPQRRSFLCLTWIRKQLIFYEWVAISHVWGWPSSCMVNVCSYSTTTHTAAFGCHYFPLDRWMLVRMMSFFIRNAMLPPQWSQRWKSAGFTDIEAYGFDWQSGIRELE